MSLAALIAPLAGKRCAVSYRLIPGAPGEKDDKLPIDPRTGLACNAMDPANWYDPTQLHAAGWPVALVLHESLNLFCVDLDACLQDDHTWTPFAQAMCAAFPGAGIEISSSGRALHIIGSADLSLVPAHHVSRRDLPGLEIYTRSRFIALTGHGFVGDIRTDHTATLQAAIAKYLPGDIGGNGPSDWWTTEPVFETPMCRIPDDEQFIQAAYAQRAGPQSVFGGHASFRDLWECKSDVLAFSYPTNQPGKHWDYNRADQALATHLGYFSGGNCERTLRLMFKSALRREKWYARDKYIRDTVRKACRGKIESAAVREQRDNVAAASTEVSTQTVAVSPVTVPPPPPAAPVLAMDAAPTLVLPVAADTPGRKPPGTWMTVNDQRELFDGITYITDIHQAFTSEGELISRERFDVLYGGYQHQMTVDGQTKTKSAWEAFTQSQCFNFPKVHGSYFDPNAPTGQIRVESGLTYVNSWVPIEIVSRPGDVSLFLQHMHNIVPDERDRTILLSYMAFITQYRGFRANWAPLLQGCPGNGKTFVSDLLTYCVGGLRYSHWPLASDLDNHFNAAFYGKLLVCVEDVKVSEAKESFWSALKPMITADRLTITPKGVDGVTRGICFNMIFNANERDAIRKTRDDRRLAPFFCPQQHEYDLQRYGMHEGSGYFNRLYGWAKDHGGYANIHHWLSQWRIPDEFHPLIMERRAPKTTSTESAIRASRSPIEQEILEAIELGKPGFRNGWISSDALEMLLMQMGKTRMISRNKRTEILEDLGYRVHPDLITGRVHLSDGTRPTLFVTRAGHETEGRGLTFDQIAAAYQASQR